MSVCLRLYYKGYTRDSSYASDHSEQRNKTSVVTGRGEKKDRWGAMGTRGEMRKKLMVVGRNCNGGCWIWRWWWCAGGDDDDDADDDIVCLLFYPYIVVAKYDRCDIKEKYCKYRKKIFLV